MSLRNFQSYSVSRRCIVGFIIYTHTNVRTYVWWKSLVPCSQSVCWANLKNLTLNDYFWQSQNVFFERIVLAVILVRKRRGKKNIIIVILTGCLGCQNVPEYCSLLLFYLRLLAIPVSDRELNVFFFFFVLVEPQLEGSEKFQFIYTYI